MFVQPINFMFVQLMNVVHFQQVPVSQGVEINTPPSHSRVPSKFMQSPYVIKFDSSDKGKVPTAFENHQTHSFEGFGICYQFSTEIINTYSEWIAKGLLRTHTARSVSNSYHVLLTSIK